MRKTTILVILSVLSLSGCFGSEKANLSSEEIPWTGQPLDSEGLPELPAPESSTVAPQAPIKNPALKQVENCDEFIDQLRMQKMAELLNIIQANFKQAWRTREQCLACDGDPYCGYHYGYADCALSADASVGTPTVDDSPEHSDTNNQVVGVDEADSVKTDGNYIYLADKNSFRILKSWPAPDTKEIAKVPISGTAKKLFILDDRALVYSARDGSGQTYPTNECTYGYYCAPTGDGSPYMISIFDIKDRKNPKLLREIKVGSSLLAARRIGDAIHTVFTRENIASFGQLKYYPEKLDPCTATKAEIYNAYANLLAENLKILKEATPADVFPVVEDKLYQGTTTKENPSPMSNCDSAMIASINDGQQLLTLLSFSINTNDPTQATTILSRPGFVYSSADNLYIAVPRTQTSDYGWYEDMDSTEALTLHQFQLEHLSPKANYIASGLVDGRVLSQFSMDEFNGNIRVATTSGYVSSYDSSAKNQITILQRKNNTLQTIGHLDNIAPTEDIRAVRFDKEKAYVVTFKKTDPLFVIDLADPTQPKILGELKIPGYSTYMHKMDDNHLLTIGLDADDVGDFAWFTGVALQIFDVSNPIDPKLKYKHVIGTRGSTSEALTNHLAFTYYAPKNVLSIPMTICEGGSGGGNYGNDLTFSGLMVFDVTTSQGFNEKGRLAFPLSDYTTCYNWWTDASSQVKRSLIIEDYVYALSEKMLKVASLADPGKELVSVDLN